MIESSGITPDSEPAEVRATGPAAGSSQAGAPSPRSVQWAQALVVVALYSFPAMLCLRLACVDDPDLWWHLHSAQWILQHHVLPSTDPFSRYGAGKPWTAFSWLFELLILQLFQRLGLVGIVLYSTTMVVAIAAALHRLIRRLQPDFSVAVLLTAVACFCLLRLYTPRPWLFSILFFILVLDLVMHARKTGRMRPLLWLPVIFALWTNIHVEFFAGLFVAAIALAETLLARKWTGIQTRLHAGWMSGIFAASVAATLVTPNGVSSYRVLFAFSQLSGFLAKISEVQAMPFRQLGDWIVLFLTLTAAGALARARRIPFFEGLLLLFAIYVSFHSQRDLWVVVVAASAILAAELKGDEKNRLQLTAFFAPFVACATALVALVGLHMLHVNNERLSADLEKGFPVRAVEFVNAKEIPGPLFNDFNWGGYLLWSQSRQVSAFGGQSPECDPQMEHLLATWDGRPEWASDPDLQKANLVIGPVTAPLTQLLRLDSRFQLAYEDKLAAVFVRRKSPASAGAAYSAAGAVSLPRR